MPEEGPEFPDATAAWIPRLWTTASRRSASPLLPSLFDVLPPKRVDYDDAIAAPLGPAHQFALRPQCRAGNQHNLVPAPRKTLAGEDRVFLRPAEDQPGNDVTNLHLRIILARRRANVKKRN